MNDTGFGVFDSYSRYYDLIYRDKDYAAEVAYIDGLLRLHGLVGRQVLELGSGTGVHGRLLADSGYQVTGIERSVEMVERARTGDGFTCQQGDIRDVQLDRSFDVVLALFHVISYQVNNRDVESVFDRAAGHLRPGGLFVFDVWYSPAVYVLRPEVRVKRVQSDGLEITRLAEPVMLVNEDRVNVRYTIFARDLGSGITQTFTETHPMRHFSLPELDLFAAGAGLERVAAEAFLSGDSPGENTWGVCLVLRKG